MLRCAAADGAVYCFVLRGLILHYRHDTDLCTIFNIGRNLCPCPVTIEINSYFTFCKVCAVRSVVCCKRVILIDIVLSQKIEGIHQSCKSLVGHQIYVTGLQIIDELGGRLHRAVLLLIYLCEVMSCKSPVLHIQCCRILHAVFNKLLQQSCQVIHVRYRRRIPLFAESLLNRGLIVDQATALDAEREAVKLAIYRYAVGLTTVCCPGLIA